MSRTLDSRTFDLVIQFDKRAHEAVGTRDKRILCAVAAQHLADLRGQAKDGRELGCLLREYLHWLLGQQDVCNLAVDYYKACLGLIAGLERLVG